jgi:hypothetical protein
VVPLTEMCPTETCVGYGWQKSPATQVSLPVQAGSQNAFAGP